MTPRIHISASPTLRDVLFSPADLDRLAGLGTLTVDDGTPVPGERLAAEHDIVVSSWDTPTLPAQLPSDARLRLVAHTGGTIRRIVPRELVDQGVLVTQAALAMASAVAEHSLTLCLALLRHLHSHDRAFQSGAGWAGENAGLGAELSAQRVGVVGASRTGQAFIRMVTALGATVTVYDPFLPADRAAELGVQLSELHPLLAGSDLVVLHAPVTAQTRGMIGAAELALLPDDAILVNTARSALLDSAALFAELDSGRIRAALDVFDSEPLPADHPLTRLPNVILTPHHAGATYQARRAQGQFAVDAVARLCTDQPLQHLVDAANYDQLA